MKIRAYIEAPHFKPTLKLKISALLLTVAIPVSSYGNNDLFGILSDVLPLPMKDIKEKMEDPAKAVQSVIPRIINPSPQPMAVKKSDEEMHIFYEAVAVGAATGAIAGNLLAKATKNNRTQGTIIGGLLGSWIGQEFAKQQIKDLRNVKLDNDRLGHLLASTRNYNQEVANHNRQLQNQINQLQSKKGRLSTQQTQMQQRIKQQITQINQRQQQIKQQSAHYVQQQQQYKQQLAITQQKQQQLQQQVARSTHNQQQIRQQIRLSASRQQQLQQQIVQLNHKKRNLSNEANQLIRKQQQLIQQNQQQSGQINQKQLTVKEGKKEIEKIIANTKRKRQEVTVVIENRYIMANASGAVQRNQLRNEIKVLERQRQDLDKKLLKLEEINRGIRYGNVDLFFIRSGNTFLA